MREFGATGGTGERPSGTAAGVVKPAQRAVRSAMPCRSQSDSARPIAQAFIRCIDLIHTNHFHLRQHILARAKFQEFLGLGNAGNGGACDPAPTQQQGQRVDLIHRSDLAHDAQGAIDIQKWQVGIEVVLSRHWFCF